MFLNFILLNIIIIIIIIIIIVIYQSQFAYTLLATIIKYQYPKTTLIDLVIDRIYAYIIRNISFNRNITLIYIL